METSGSNTRRPQQTIGGGRSRRQAGVEADEGGSGKRNRDFGEKAVHLTIKPSPINTSPILFDSKFEAVHLSNSTNSPRIKSVTADYFLLSHLDALVCAHLSPKCKVIIIMD